MTEAGRRLRKTTLLVAAVASFSLGGLAGTAVAVSWHQTQGLYHGFQHFSSTTDGHFAARVDYSTGTRGCEIDSITRPEGYRRILVYDPYTLCNVDSWDIWSSATECLYRAETYSSWAFNWHHNYPDNYCR